MRFVLLILLFCSSFAFAGSEPSRTENRFGAYLSGHGQPAPAMGGVNLAFNFTSFLRLSGGVGYYDNRVSHLPAYGYNYTVVPLIYGTTHLLKPVFYGLAWMFDAFGQFMSKGKVPAHLKYRDFWSGFEYENLRKSTPGAQSVFTYGSGLNLFIPGISFSPTLGVNFAHYATTNGAYDLPDSGSHLYYSGGLDYQGPSGGNLAAGFNYCPNTHVKKLCGVYVNAGFFF